MKLIDSLLKKITVDFTEQTFKLEVTDERQQVLIEGKLSMGQPYCRNFVFAAPTLTFKPDLLTWNLKAILDQFKKVLEDIA